LALLYSPDLVVPVQNLLDARRPKDKELVRTKLRLLGVDDDQIREIERNGKPVNHIRIRSPMHGHVIRKYAVEGDYVDEGARLYFVADLSTVWIEAQFYENELAFLRMGQKVRATTAAFPNRVFEGRVSFIHPHLDQSTRTLTVRFELENPHHELRPGMYATVQAEIPAPVLEGVRDGLRDDWLKQNSVLTLAHSLFSPVLPSPALAMDTMIDAAGREVLRRQDLVLAVPESAVIDTGSRKIVYRQASPGIYEGVEVQLGPRCGDYYPLLGGLVVGERVATNGSFLIDADTRLNPAAGSTYFGASGGPRETASAGGSSASKEEVNVRMALAKLSASDRRLAEAQRFCAVQTANRLGSMGPPVKIMIQDQAVFLCCAGCRQEATDHPQQTLTTLANLKSEKLPKVGTSAKEDMP
jgi:Cu(I)/Ag(I) efflux system membrane fusion protein